MTSCRAAAGADVGLGQDGPDLLSGGPDDDHLEGDGGNDGVYGDRPLPEAVPAALVPLLSSTSPEVLQGPAGPDGQDDLIGGSTNLPGTSSTRVGRNGFRDGDDTVFGDGAADFVLGDNGTLFRDKPVDGDYPRIVERYPAASGTSTTRAIVRHALRSDVPTDGVPPAGRSGDDTVSGGPGEDFIWGQSGKDVLGGNDGDDDLYGELGDDRISGDAGDDAVVADRGGIVSTFIGAGKQKTVSLNAPPAETFTYFRPGTLDRRVDLLHDAAAHASPTGSTAVFATTLLASDGVARGGADRVRGGTGHDSLHGAAGPDLVNGDSGGDYVFGDDGSDVLWGGRGCDPPSTPRPSRPTATAEGRSSRAPAARVTGWWTACSAATAGW